MTNFTRLQKAKCVLWFSEYGHIKNVKENFENEFAGEDVPTQEQILQWYDNFKTTGSVEEQEKVTDIHTTTYEKETGLLNFFGFKKIHRCHPYKMHLNAALEKENLEERKKFAEVQNFYTFCQEY